MTLLTALQLSLDWLAFSFHYSVSLSPQSTILYIPLSVHLYVHRSLFPIAIPPFFFSALTSSPSLFLFASPLFYYFFPHLYFWLSLYLPTSTTCLSCSISLFISLTYFTFYLSLFPFPPTVLITILNSLSFQYVWYSGTGVSCIAGEFFTSWAIREALFKDWHLLTDFSTLICWDFPGFL